MNKNLTAVIREIHGQCTWSQCNQCGKQCYFQVCFQLRRYGNNTGLYVQFGHKYNSDHVNISKNQFPKEYNCQFDKGPYSPEIEIKKQKPAHNEENANPDQITNQKIDNTITILQKHPY